MAHWFALILFFITFGVNAQKSAFVPGYIVDNKGDTVKGFVKNIINSGYHLSSDLVKFKRVENGSVVEYGPLQILSFQVGPDRYVSKVVEGKFGMVYQKDVGGNMHVSMTKTAKRFLRVVVGGDLNLYELQEISRGLIISINASSPSNPQNIYIFRFLQRNTEDTLFYLRQNDIKSKMIDYFRVDAGDIAVKIFNENFPRKHAEEYVKEYNLLKYVPSPAKSHRKSTAIFYKRLNKRSAGLILTINDTITYTIPEKYVGAISIPVDTRTKVCYGTESNKVCDLILGVPFYPLPVYYELQANGGKESFEIEQKNTYEAEQNLRQLKEQKY